jgi:4-amino-4-deoxy-L-arabinose transferase-like glycosyltransferase
LQLANLNFKYQKIAILIVVLLATGVRLWSLNALGFNSDEAVYAGQAAAIRQDPLLSPFFPVFRAHPLFFQFILSIVYEVWTADWSARLLSVLFGVGTVLLTYRLGRLLYNPETGLIAALLLAMMPYHVVVSRQVLLDGPMTFFATLTLYLLARFALTERPAWLYLTGAALGLTFLAKETGILFAGAVYIFLALSPSVKMRLRDLLISVGIMLVTMLPYPLSIVLAGGGGSENSGNYLVWQFFRRPNHPWSFYLETIPWEIGPLVLLLMLVGLVILRKEMSWRETLLLTWILVPVVFFQLWLTKGYQYLLPVVPACSLLAARPIDYWISGPANNARRGKLTGIFGWSILVLTMITLLMPTLQKVIPSASDKFLAGSGGIPGGRETGLWIRENTPEGSTFMTIGPSMANILQFYGQRQAYGISVSPNPLYRNPSYQPVRNPDRQIRLGEIQYLVWDAYSAGRTSFFSNKIREYVQKYKGRVIHVESVTLDSDGSGSISQPVIIIYQVRP